LIVTMDSWEGSEAAGVVGSPMYEAATVKPINTRHSPFLSLRRLTGPPV
jgi:hypothetical protein